jgi:hypothetical protein
MQNFLDTHHLNLRKYTEADLDKVGQLLSTHYEAEYIPTRKILFDWVACHNPATDEKCYLVVEDDKNIIAYEGRMPVDFMINGAKVRGYFYHDTLVHPEYRKNGSGVALVSSLKSAWEEATTTFAVALWMNDFTHEILKRRGYQQVNAHDYVKPLSFNSVLTRKIKKKIPVKMISPICDGLNSCYDYIFSTRIAGNVLISKITRFDDRFDEFAEKTAKKFYLSVVRHSKYLNWKYVDNPFCHYTIFTAEKNKELTGYIVLLLRKNGDYKLGIIVDILADPADSQTIVSLCRTAIKFFKMQKADSVRCVLTNKSFISIFKKHLFIEDHGQIPVMVGNHRGHLPQKPMMEIGNWFLTFGDSDAVMWERDVMQTNTNI